MFSAVVIFPQINRRRRQTMRAFTTDIFLEGEYNEDLYDRVMVDHVIRDWVLRGLLDEDIDINEILVSGGAV